MLMSKYLKAVTTAKNILYHPCFRGDLVGRPIDSSIMTEAGCAQKRRRQELLIISQDTSAHGVARS